MKEQLRCEQAVMTAGSGALAGFLPIPEVAREEEAPRLTGMEELRLARLEAIEGNAGEQVAWLWVAGSALVLIGLSFLLW